MQQASSDPALVLEEGILYNDRILSGIRGRPSVWIEMGRVRERQKWQAFTCQLLDAAICSELEELKRGVAETLRSSAFSAPLTHHVLHLIDSRKKNIATILEDFTAPISNDSDAARDACPSAADSSVEAAAVDPEPAAEARSRLNVFQGIGLFVGSIILLRLLS